MSVKCNECKVEDQSVLRAQGLSNSKSCVHHVYNGTVPTREEQGAIIYYFQGIV